MPAVYNKIQLGQLISAIWSKYLSLQGGDIETQKQLLAKEKEIFQKDKELQETKTKLQNEKAKNKIDSHIEEFNVLKSSGKLTSFIEAKETILGSGYVDPEDIPQYADALAYGLIDFHTKNPHYFSITEKGKQFFKWLLVENEK